jgi:hypothetical protein
MTTHANVALDLSRYIAVLFVEIADKAARQKTSIIELNTWGEPFISAS